MKTVQMIKDGKVIDSYEIADEAYPEFMHRAQLQAQLNSRDIGGEWEASEYKEPEPVKALSAEQEQEILIAQKKDEILRSMAIAELGIADPKSVVK